MFVKCSWCGIEKQCKKIKYLRAQNKEDSYDICKECDMLETSKRRCVYDADGTCEQGIYTEVGPGAGLFWDHFGCPICPKCKRADCKECREKLKKDWAKVIFICVKHKDLKAHYERRENIKRGLIRI